MIQKQINVFINVEYNREYLNCRLSDVHFYLFVI